MLKIKFLFVFFFALFVANSFAQSNDYELGAAPQTQYRQQGGFFDYSDPRTVNIKVAIWGGVKFPGKYIVPEESTVNDLLSYAGGPVVDAELDELRLFRTAADSSSKMIKFNLNDLLWEKNLNNNSIKLPKLMAGDIFLVPVYPKYFFREWLSIGLSVFSALVSLAILLTK